MVSRMVPIFLLSAYLLFLLPGDTSAREPTSTRRRCNSGLPLTSSDVKLEIFSASTLSGSNPVGTKLSCSPRQPLRGPTKVVMHGFVSDGQSLKKEGFVEAYKGKGANLIIVDWSRLASIGDKRFYITAAACALEVGRYLAKCLNSLDVDGSNLHLFGHSLGAHGVGMAGRELAKLDRKPSRVTGRELVKLSRTPSRVTGMDPAGPGFTRSTIADFALATYFRTEIIDDLRKMKIGRDSGHFVDIVHSNPGELGSKDRLGHVDYDVNGVNADSISSRVQPRCSSKLIGKDAKDSHSYAVKVVVASLRNEQQSFGKDRRNAKSHFNVDQRRADIPNGSYYLKTNIEC